MASPPPRATLAAALALAFLPGLPVRADQTDAAIFDVSIRGVRAATLSLSGAEEGRAYAVSGVLKSSGVLGFFRRIRYDAGVAGTLSGNRFTPSRYTETADTGRRRSAAVMSYRAGVPQIKSYDPPRPPRVEEINPATQGGTVDPLTALFAVMRDVSPAQACNLTLVMFDGRRRSQITLGKAERSGGAIACAGEYRRLKGFSAEDMAEKTRFPFRLTYGDAGGGRVHVTEVSMDTLYGKGRMIRR